jgi:integrase
MGFHLMSADVSRLRDVADGSPHALTLAAVAVAGVRRGEAMGLCWRNIDLRAGTATITTTTI